MPANWWLNTDGLAITSDSQFKELISSQEATLADKHVFIDFYMQGCYWCYVFQKEWNDLVTDMKEMYGEDNVEFVKIDGQKVYEPSRKYSVHSFPTFVYVQPNTRGLKAIVFRGDRTYDNMKSWMMKILKDLPILNQGEDEDMEEELEEEEYMEPYTPLVTPPKPIKQGLDPQIYSILKDITSCLTTQDSTLSMILSQQKKAIQSEKSDHSELSKLEESILAKLDSLKPMETVEQPPLVYLMAGIIVGIIVAVIMVGFINKTSAAGKKKRIAQDSTAVGKVDEEKLC